MYLSKYHGDGVRLFVFLPTILFRHGFCEMAFTVNQNLHIFREWRRCGAGGVAWGVVQNVSKSFERETMSTLHRLNHRMCRNH